MPHHEGTQGFVVRYGRLNPATFKGRIIRNPGYGGPGVGINGWVSHPALSQNRKPCFMESLRKSIRKEGFRNPIIVYSTPAGVFLGFGGSRAQAALDLGLKDIPCIINDYTGEFEDCPEVTEDNWTLYFRDIPEWHEFGEKGFDYHYSLERNRRNTYDKAGFAWADDPTPFKHEFDWVEEWK